MPEGRSQRGPESASQSRRTEYNDSLESRGAGHQENEQAGLRMSREATARERSSGSESGDRARSVRGMPDQLYHEFPTGTRGHGLQPGNYPDFRRDDRGVVEFTTPRGTYTRTGDNRWHNSTDNTDVDAFVKEGNGTLSITYKQGGAQEIYTPAGTVIHRQPDGSAFEQMNNADGTVVRTRSSRGVDEQYFYHPDTKQLTHYALSGRLAPVRLLADGRPVFTIDKDTGATVYEDNVGNKSYHNLDGFSSLDRPYLSGVMPRNVEYDGNAKPSKVTYIDGSTFEGNFEGTDRLESFTTRTGASYTRDKITGTYKSPKGHEINRVEQSADGTVTLFYTQGETRKLTPDGRQTSFEYGKWVQPSRITPRGENAAVGQPMHGEPLPGIKRRGDGSKIDAVPSSGPEAASVAEVAPLAREGRRTGARFENATGEAPLELAFGPVDVRSTTSGSHVEIMSANTAHHPTGRASEVTTESIERVKKALLGDTGLDPKIRAEALEAMKLLELNENRFAAEQFIQMHTEARGGISKSGAAAIGVGVVALALASWYAAHKMASSQESYIPPATVK